jgi:archaellum component FlaC
LSKLLNHIISLHESRISPTTVIDSKGHNDRLTRNQAIFKHYFSNRLSNMYVVSQVGSTGLIELDKCLTSYENKLKIGKNLLFGLTGFIGGAGHALHEAGKMCGGLDAIMNSPIKEWVEVGIEYAITCGRLFEPLEKAGHIHHTVAGEGHTQNISENNQKLGQWKNTQEQLANLNNGFSHCGAFNMKHDELALQIAYHYQTQLDGLSSDLDVQQFAEACANHWLEALQMGYFIPNYGLSDHGLMEKGLAWMQYINLNENYAKKVKFNNKNVLINTLLKQPNLTTHCQQPIANQQPSNPLQEASVQYKWVKIHPTYVCSALEGRLIKNMTFDPYLGYRLATECEVSVAKNNKPGVLINWPNVLILEATPEFQDPQVKKEKLFEHLKYKSCPYAETWKLEQRVKYLEEKLSSLESKYDERAQGQDKYRQAMEDGIKNLRNEVKNLKNEIKQLREEFNALKSEVHKPIGKNDKDDLHENINPLLDQSVFSNGINRSNAVNSDISSSTTQRHDDSLTLNGNNNR